MRPAEPAPTDPGEPTRLLRRMGAGDSGAAEELLPLIYGELRAAADRAMRGERREHTLQPTALVHEAWLRLCEGGDFADRKHFVGVAVRAMRQILVDHARSRGAAKRGGDRQRVPLDDLVEELEGRSFGLVELDETLGRLAAKDGELARLVEMRFFGGMTVAETAELMGVPARRVERRWEIARAWLHGELGRGGDGG